MKDYKRIIFSGMIHLAVVFAVFQLWAAAVPEDRPLSLRPQKAYASGESDLDGLSGSCGANAAWTFDPAKQVLTITGSGKIGGTSSAESPFYKKSSIKKVVIKKGITEIGSYVFQGCINLEEAVLPEGLKVIGMNAFRDCSSLSVIDLPDSVTEMRGSCFNGCELLDFSVLPPRVEVIGQNFIFGTNTKTITVPGTVKEINYRAFGGCGMEEIVLEEGIEELGQEAFNDTDIKSIHIPASVNAIRSDSMICRSLLEITVDSKNPKYSSKDGVLYSKDKSTLIAYPCGRTGSFKVPSGVIELGGDAFFDSSLDSVKLPESVSSIGGEVFRGSKIRTINIPSKVSYISFYDFDGCQNLESIDVSSDNLYYTDADGVLFTKDMTQLIRYPSSRTGVYRVPESVTTVGELAFDHSSLSRIILPEDLQMIGFGAFRFSSELTDLIIPENVTELQMDMFAGCYNLERVVFLNRDFTAETKVYNMMYYTAICQFYGYDDAKVNGIPLSEYITDNFNDQFDYHVISIRDRNTVVKTTPSRSVQLTASATLGPDPEWIVSDPYVAFIDGSGKLTPLQGGLIDAFALGENRAERIRVLTGFRDVVKGDYYYDPVYWASDRGITAGIRDPKSGLYETFDPRGKCTRAQMVSFLWRMAGCPEPKKTSSVFTDIRPTDYYYKAVLWGTENHIVGGYSDHTFRPGNNCTRQQAVTFLWRYYGCPVPKTSVSSFPDVTNTGAYYYKAVLWASESGVTGGYPDGNFKPENVCSRSQMVTFLYRCRKF